VEAFVDALLSNGRSKSPAKAVLTSLKAIMKEAMRRGLVAQNVASTVSIRMSDRDRREIEIPTREQLAAIIEASRMLGGSPFSSRLR
jgi:predicted transcriptional regulator